MASEWKPVGQTAASNLVEADCRCRRGLDGWHHGRTIESFCNM